MKHVASRARMQGFSLVEVMVSVVIGMVVVAAVLVSYLSSGKTSRQQAAYAEMHENAQMAITLLSRDLLLAGYAQPTGIPTVAAPAVSKFSRAYEGNAVFGCDTGFTTPDASGAVTCAASGTKPAIEVSYEADTANTVKVGGSEPSDCKGTAITADPGSGIYVAHNRFYLKTGPSGRSELYCASSEGGSEPLVDNVEYMKIWYGEANAVDPRQIVRYAAAGNVTDWGRIVSVRICLLMRSSEPVLDKELTSTPKYLDCDSTEQNLPDSYLRRAYFTTTTLRNKMAF